jgi:hypothetical protein
LQEFDFVFLGGLYSACHIEKGLLVGALGNQLRHINGLLMMNDHILNESDVLDRKTCLAN